MAEAFSFAEGTARFVTGAATSVATYVQGVNAVMTIGYHRRRAPHSTLWTYYETAREATLSIDQIYSQKDIAAIFNGATAGGVHVQLIHAAVGVTGTLWLYSGVIDSHSMDGSEGNVMMRAVRGRFQTWSET
jgi:hypothetical protein